MKVTRFMILGMRWRFPQAVSFLDEGSVSITEYRIPDKRTITGGNTVTFKESCSLYRE